MFVFFLTLARRWKYRIDYANADFSEGQFGYWMQIFICHSCLGFSLNISNISISSKETVEVISSLLSFSDQTDPFNRSPLTMDQIRPNTELKEKIQQWLAERKKQKEDLEDTLN